MPSLCGNTFSTGSSLCRHTLFVSKEDKDNKTITHVTELDEKGRIDQLALISSGSITDISKKAAQELYRRNHS